MCEILEEQVTEEVVEEQVVEEEVHECEGVPCECEGGSHECCRQEDEPIMRVYTPTSC